MEKSNMPKTQLSQAWSLHMQRWAVLRKINDTVLVFQTLSWFACYHFFRQPVIFLPICSLWNPWFLSHREYCFRSKIKHSLCSTLNSPWCSQPGFLLQRTACLEVPPRGNYTVAKLLNSGSAFNVLVLPSQERELWTRSFIMDLSGHEIHSLRKHLQ